MSTPDKGNEHIEADDRAFKDAVERAGREFRRIEGVVGVGYGIREKAGAFGDELAILVYVIRKLPDAELTPDQRIPARFDGYRVDVRVLPQLQLSAADCQDDRKFDTITGGIQIEPGGKYTFKEVPGVGTLGCIVHKRGGGTGNDNIYLLTCHHVLWRKDDDGLRLIFDDDKVFHPYAPHSDKERASIPLGKITKELSFKGHIGANRKQVPDEPSLDPAPYLSQLPADVPGNYVDAAAVRIDLGSFCCGSACTPNDLRHDTTIPGLNPGTALPPGVQQSDRDRVVDVRDLRAEPTSNLTNLRVVKRGRTTGWTEGRVVAISPGHILEDTDPTLPRKVKVIAFHVLEIVPITGTPPWNNCLFAMTGQPVNAFSWEGDSGSLILDEKNHAVGLLYGGEHNKYVTTPQKTYACLIVPVLDALGMCIPTTTGKKYGSSKAEDGSGVAMYGGDWELPGEDKTLFARRETSGVLKKEQVEPPAPATDEQRAVMQPLLQALRETRRGRELHEDFTQLSREIAYLVRRCRPVTVAWHRHRGPAFLVCAVNHLKGEAAQVPATIQSVSRHTLLTRMETVLRRHGSNALRDALDRHRDLLLSCSSALTAGECLDILRRVETTECSV